MKISEVMTRDVITVTADTTIAEAARLLAEHRISGLPVIDRENRVIGMITEGDLVARERKLRVPAFTEILGGVIFLESPQHFFDGLKKIAATSVGEIMTAPVHTVGSEATPEDAAAMMVEKKVNRLPVLDAEGRLLGIVSRHDLIRTMV
ncbi:MAG TPA: CBS domain-containing protein [Firmicutes bacterium]|nr:CBS domain-containing protein [Bacillota bacterium]